MLEVGTTIKLTRLNKDLIPIKIRKSNLKKILIKKDLSATPLLKIFKELSQLSISKKPLILTVG